MANTGDVYTIVLKESHIRWGEHRYTTSRGIEYFEGYIPIPRMYAIRYNLHNSNAHPHIDVLGDNIFNFCSSDGTISGILKAQGAKEAGDIYAKQFSVSGELKTLGYWYTYNGASVGDVVEVRWTSPTDIVISLI